MKNILIASLLFFLCNTSCSRKKSLSKHFPTVTKEKLSEIKYMSDIDPNYPKEYYNTLIDYVSVEITGTYKRKHVTSIGKSDTLTMEQTALLKKVAAGSLVIANIKFTYKDPKNDDMGGKNKIKEMGLLVIVAK